MTKKRARVWVRVGERATAQLASLLNSCVFVYKVGEYRVEASDSKNCKAYLTSNHHIIAMVLEVWSVCFGFMA